MFPQQKQQEPQQQKIEKQFMGLDRKTNWMWWKEQISYLFISTNQITEVKLIPATDGSFNVYARIDLKDRFEYFLIDNKKTLAAAKKLAEEFTQILLGIKEKEVSKTKDIEEINKSDLNGLEALKVLKKDLEN